MKEFEEKVGGSTFRTRLIAIWKIISSQYFFLSTGDGSVSAIYPKSTDDIHLIQRLVNIWSDSKAIRAEAERVK